MVIHVLTLFPDYFSSPLETGLLGRGIADGQLAVRIHDLRSWTHDRHGTADDYAYGGGPGMVLKPEPFFEAIDTLREEGLEASAEVLLTTPQGVMFDQAAARDLSELEEFVVLCGRYRGIDERVRSGLVTREYSVGDVILNGGEGAALLIVEAVARLLPGVIGDPASVGADSFETGILDHPHFTRPSEYRGMEVPSTLMSGDHGAIEQWRRREALRLTLERRPDLLRSAPLSDEDREYLQQLERERPGGSTPGPMKE
jgi:tRNA (guanine37-N1)-methyltransferase